MGGVDKGWSGGKQEVVIGREVGEELWIDCKMKIKNKLIFLKKLNEEANCEEIQFILRRKGIIYP